MLSKDMRIAKRMEAVEILLSTVEDRYNAFGEVREGLVDTPKRVAKMYEEIFAGYHMTPADILGTSFKEDKCDELVLVKDIPFYSHCEHHMVPFFGTIHIAYIPNGKVVGISKLARLVECFARRLQIQERLTSQIADAIQEIMEPLGVAVIVQAEHMCMTMRGVQKPGTRTVTSSMHGVFRDNENNARIELMQLINMK